MKRSNTVIGALGALFLILAVAAGLSLNACTPTPRSGNTGIRLDNYADLFLRGTYDMLHTIKVREIVKLGRACQIATARKLAGGQIL